MTYTDEKIRAIAKAVKRIAQQGKFFHGAPFAEADIHTEYRHGKRYQYREDLYKNRKVATVSEMGRTILSIEWDGKVKKTRVQVVPK